MNVSFTENAWEESFYWQKMDKKIVKRINDVVDGSLRDREFEQTYKEF